jgi:biotin-dependent carboxylase-like uncharacterized protein
MDPYALRMANLIVGNDEGQACLEVTLMGPKLAFASDGVIAITGADLSPAINGRPVTMWKALFVKAGDELSFGAPKTGCRAYIAFAGGIAVPPVMGSRSTFIRGGYGGLKGRALKAGDRLPLGKAQYDFADVSGRKLPPAFIPDYETDRPVRFVFGPQADAFTDEAILTFTTKPYTVSRDSDRMGYRMEGPRLTHKTGADIISDVITVGAIQVPANGQPIVLMADCQMSGGYTKIGVVATVDIPYMAQKKPGDSVYFQPVSVNEAQSWLKEQEEVFAVLRLNNSLLKTRRKSDK